MGLPGTGAPPALWGYPGYRRLRPVAPSTARRTLTCVRFSAEHRFPGAPAAVAAVLGDPDFYRELELPDLRLLEVRPARSPRSEVGSRVGAASSGPPQDLALVLRYEFTGSLDGVALRLLGGERLTWSQEVHLRGGSGGRLEFAAEAAPRVLYGHADFVLEPEPQAGPRPEGETVTEPVADPEDRVDRANGSDRVAAGTSTIRRLDGELVVALPVVGATAERRIVPGVLQRLGVEAVAVRRRLLAHPL